MVTKITFWRERFSAYVYISYGNFAVDTLILILERNYRASGIVFYLWIY